MSLPSIIAVRVSIRSKTGLDGDYCVRGLASVAGDVGGSTGHLRRYTKRTQHLCASYCSSAFVSSRGSCGDDLAVPAITLDLSEVAQEKVTEPHDGAPWRRDYDRKGEPQLHYG